MALNLQHEFAYSEKPAIPVRLFVGQASVVTEALLDTGASVSLFDAELAAALGLGWLSPQGRYGFDVIGVGGNVRRIPCLYVGLSVIGAPDDLTFTSLFIGFVPHLATSVGNLLGRNLFEMVDFGLHHHVLPSRRLYLGRV